MPKVLLVTTAVEAMQLELQPVVEKAVKWCEGVRRRVLLDVVDKSEDQLISELRLDPDIEKKALMYGDDVLFGDALRSIPNRADRFLRFLRGDLLLYGADLHLDEQSGLLVVSTEAKADALLAGRWHAIPPGWTAIAQAAEVGVISACGIRRLERLHLFEHS